MISHLLSTLFFVKPVISYLLLLEFQDPSWLGVTRRAPKLVVCLEMFVHLHVLVSDFSDLRVAKGRLRSSRSECSSLVPQRRRRLLVWR
jgi:hypothetical protein